jgi:hypothetical protein
LFFKAAINIKRFALHPQALVAFEEKAEGITAHG